MKYVQIILAVYIFYLNIRPCGDLNTCLDEQRTGMSVVAADSHDHSEAEQDLCTPFCICSCCASHAQMGYSPVAISNPVVLNVDMSTPYRHGGFADNSHSIWQPPKV